MTHDLQHGQSGSVRILHAVDSLRPGGTELGLAKLIELMDPRFEHMVCSFRGGGPIPESFEGLPITFLDKQPGHDWSLSLRIAGICRLLRPDVVHARNWATIDAVIGARLAGVPVLIQSEHGRGLDDPRGRSPRRRLVRRMLAPFIAKHVVVAEHLKDWLVQGIGLKESKVAVVFNGVDTRTYKPPDARDRETLRREHGYDSEHVVFGAVGRLDPVKDYGTLIEAFGRAVSRHPESRLILVGDGPERSRLETAIRDLGLEESVQFAGHREDVSRVLAAMDVFVHPSLVEGLSNAILEASATALPVVASRAAGNREIVEEGVTGQLVATGDPVDLSDTMVSYASNPALRLAHGAAGRRRVETHFPLSNMIAGYTRIYEEALQRRRRYVEPHSGRAARG